MFWVAFTLGLMGSFHCVGMCSPITLLLPLRSNSLVGKVLQVLIYFTGKTFTYLCLGFAFALIGKGLFIADYQQFFSIFTGVAMVVVALGMLLGKKVNVIDKQLFAVLNELKKLLGNNIRKKNYTSTFFIGFFNGFLPCGLVYMALFGALTQASIQGSLFYMLGFSLGVIPLMLLVIFFGNFISVAVRNLVQKAIPILVLLIGILFIVRGLGLGATYLSPAQQSLIISEDPSCVTPVP